MRQPNATDASSPTVAGSAVKSRRDGCAHRAAEPGASVCCRASSVDDSSSSASAVNAAYDTVGSGGTSAGAGQDHVSVVAGRVAARSSSAASRNSANDAHGAVVRAALALGLFCAARRRLVVAVQRCTAARSSSMDIALCVCISLLRRRASGDASTAVLTAGTRRVHLA